jgi:hypothetical protein
MWNGLSHHYRKLPPEDRRTFDKWMRANLIVGGIFVLAMVAMAVAGSNSSRRPDVQIAATPKAPAATTADKGRRPQ